MVVSQVSANERQTFITLFIIYHFEISQAVLMILKIIFKF